jgi:hypothetical protein
LDGTTPASFRSRIHAAKVAGKLGKGVLRYDRKAALSMRFGAIEGVDNDLFT